ncbi:MAG: transposase [Lacunisphaera sp.]|nr:transposase [Lacunisphaera sp.]
MARKLRIQYEGAIYHVINRGNYRRDVFGTAGAAQAFEKVVLEACALHGWRLHAQVVMRNHYHLAVETPRANLVEGMHWLQSTFATRFNRLRQARGHLFQGRYQALLVEDAAALARVVDYIHLNPVRAGATTPAQLASFRWSSLRVFLSAERPAQLVCADWLRQHGWTDSSAGLRAYVAYLIGLARDEAEQKRLGLQKLSAGWAIGTLAWRKQIAQDHAHRALSPGVEAGELTELKEAHWTLILERELKQAGKTAKDATESIGCAPWKITAARRLRQAGARYAWITAALRMGKTSSVRAYLCQTRK